MSIESSAVIGALITIAYIIGYCFGERRGIRDTEERWSLAVAVKSAREALAALPPAAPPQETKL